MNQTQITVNRLAMPIVLFIAATSACLAEPIESKVAETRISAATKSDDGFLIHTVESPYQDGKTQIRVLLPEHREDGKKYPVIYVLPVEAGNENRFGDGLAEVKKNDLHNKHGVIFVAPTFSALPWYADHPTNPRIRQESYFVEVVVPFIDKTYPTLAERKGRLLLGFSKSGWGAWSLLLRHPDQFEKAAAWDAPLNKEKPDQFGMDKIFATQDNFEKYQITTLLKQQAKPLSESTRLILTGYGNFRDQHVAVHSLMNELKIRHEYRDEPQLKHEWGSGWMPDAVELLVAKGDR